MELRIEKGLGFVIAKQDKRNKLDIGQISIDSIFTPIRNVNFRVENMRVGKRTDFDRLFLEIETDGTIDPEDAFKEASQILIDHFSALIGEREEIIKKEEEEISDEKIKVEDMDISPKIVKILIENNIKTSVGLAKRSEESLLKLEGIGEKGIEEIKKGLKKLGLELK